MAAKISWDNAYFTWNNNSHTWDEVLLVIEAVEVLRGGGDIDKDMPWVKDQDKNIRLIKLICKVKGKTIKQTKEIKNYKIKASDIKLLAEEVLGIEVLTENIKF